MELNSLKQMFNSYIRSWKTNGINHVTTLIVLSFAFTIILSLSTLTLNLERILTSWGKNTEITVYLSDSVEKSTISNLEMQLNKISQIESTKFITKKDAHLEFKEQMSQYAPELMDDEDLASALPQSFRLNLKPHVESNHLASLSEKISSFAGVDEVSYGQQWVSQYSAIVEGFKKSGWFINLTILLSSLFIVGNAIRMSISQKREEIEILELVGATNNMIRVPFVFEGALTGGLASAMAITLSYLVVVAEREIASSIGFFWNFSQQIAFLDAYKLVLFILFGSLSGALGSYLCVRKLNSGWAASRRLGGSH